tara:strand:- start:782 stop:1639 length:858 start_codon:yes stop_codon:yes gene_type:complete
MAFPSVNISSTSDLSTTITNIQTGPLQFKSMITGHKVQFKAFIESLSNSFKSTWNTENVYGRMDPVATFQNTQRTIAISWVIPAANISEAQHNLNAIASLSSMLYPGYSSNPVTVDNNTFTTANSISRSPLIKMKFANLINAAGESGEGSDGLLGYVDGFDHQIEVSMGFFINNKKMYPKVIKLSCNFTVLHQHDLGFDNDNDWISGNDSSWIYDNDQKLEGPTPEVAGDTPDSQDQDTTNAANQKNQEKIQEAERKLDECIAQNGSTSEKCIDLFLELEALKSE